MSKERIQWVDWCKGLGIMLVLLGHTLRTDVSLVYIYGFHMPLFFFMSGLVCNEKKFNWSSFIKSRFNTLIIPYVFFYLLTWLYWLFVERSFRPISLQWWQPLLGMVYGAQWHGLMDHNGILWFLTCLFTTEVIFFAVSKLPRKWQQLLIVVVFAAVGTLFDFNLPWCLNIAMVALQFFWLGNNCRGVLLSGEEKISKTGGLVLSIILAVIYLTLSFLLKNRVNMATNDYGNIWAFEFLAFIGVIGFVLLCKSLISNKINGGGGLGETPWLSLRYINQY